MKILNDENLNADGFDFLIGEIINKVEATNKGYDLVTKSGYIIKIEENEGCVCANGNSVLPDLKLLEKSDNAITNVEVKYASDDEFDEDDSFRMFIYYHDTKFDLGEGTDGYGNGYYGGGFWVTISEVDEEEVEE